MTAEFCTCSKPLHTADGNCLNCAKPVQIGEFHLRWHTGYVWDCKHCERILQLRREAEREAEKG